MKYTHNYKNTKENLTVVGCLFFIGGIIALPFVGVTSIIAIMISFLFFWSVQESNVFTHNFIIVVHIANSYFA